LGDGIFLVVDLDTMVSEKIDKNLLIEEKEKLESDNASLSMPTTLEAQAEWCRKNFGFGTEGQRKLHNENRIKEINSVIERLI
jgi:hypothetical protein